MKHKINFTVLVITLLLFPVLLYIPLINDVLPRRALAILVAVAILWMTEAIPLSLTGLLIPVAATFLGLLPSNSAFNQFAHPVIFLFMGGFVLAGALTRHRLDQVLAHKLIKFSKGNFYRSSVLIMISTSIISFWVSNTSAAIIMLPLGIGILTLAGKKTFSKESNFLLLGIAYSASIGGVVTLVGSPPNAIGAALLKISFSEWFMYGIIIFIVTFPFLIAILTWYFKPDRKLMIGEAIPSQHSIPINKSLLVILGITVTLWLSEGIIAPLMGIGDNFSSLVSILAIAMITLSGVLKWDEVVVSIEWKVLLLFGGGLTLGKILDTSGLGLILANQVSLLAGQLPFLLFLWMLILFSIILTEFMSNTASAALILPILYSLAVKLEINPALIVLPATIAATYGFMLPAGTPPNAVVYSSGLVPQKEMVKVGLVLNIIFSVILTLYFYFILPNG